MGIFLEFHGNFYGDLMNFDVDLTSINLVKW